MSEKRAPRSKASSTDLADKKVLGRRKALKGLGFLAFAAPTLASCSSSGGPGDMGTGGVGTGGSGTGGTGTGGTGTGGTGTGGSATGGVKATGGTPTGGAPATGGAGTGGTATGGAATGGAKATGGAGGAPGTGGAGGSGGSVGTLTSPPWSGVPVQDSTNADMPKMLMCNAVTKRDGAGQGPFFIHELEKDDDISLVRQDLRGQYNKDAAPGVDMELYVRIIDKNKSDAACNMLVPVPDVEVYIWHTDGQGFYSGFGTRGTDDEQKPDTPYSGKPSSMNLENTDRFCRGLQTTNADGVVGFLSHFPGWYNGRDVHIHIVVFKKGSKSHGRVDYSKSNEPLWVFTTQFYFDPKFTASIHENYDPYKARTMGSLKTAYEGAIKADESGNSGRHCTATKMGDKVIAQIQMVVDAS